MQWSMGFRLCVFVAFAAFAADALAGRKSVRVDGGAGWNDFAIGSADCPGTTAGLDADDTLVRRFGHVFSGHAHVEHLEETYCEIAFNDVANAFDPRVDDAAYTNFGVAVANIISYSFLDGPDVFNATSFQWEFIELANGTTLVHLRGDEVLDADAYIEREIGAVQVWSGAGNTYDGEYFCFRNNAYVGTWDGEGGFQNSPCAQAGGVTPVAVTVPTLGDATRTLLVLLFATLAVTALRRR